MIRSKESNRADKYSGSLDDVFEIQERVSRAIVDSLRIQLTAEDRRRLARRATSSGYAFDVYLRARRDILTFSADRLDAARRDLSAALARTGDDVLLLRAIGMRRGSTSTPASAPPRNISTKPSGARTAFWSSIPMARTDPRSSD